MTASQLLIWTALPTGRKGNTLTLSVYLAPQLTGTVPAGKSFTPLSEFPDFVDWPKSIMSAPDGPITFTVGFAGTSGTVSVPATIVATRVPHGFNPSTAWKAIFNPNTTAVTPFTFTDYSLKGVRSFPVGEIAAFVSSIYGTLGTTTPTDPIILNAGLGGRSGSGGSFTADNQALQPVYEALFGLNPPSDTGKGPVEFGPITVPTVAFDEVRTFHAAPDLPVDTVYPVPTPPTLDFHQGLTGLNNYPEVLRLFHLVFDLTVTLPAGVPASTKVMVVPAWTSALGASSTNVSPWTAATLTAKSFRPTPLGPDYRNGMLDLNDASRFFVTDLDTDLAADRLDSLSTNLQSTYRAQYAQSRATYGESVLGTQAVTVPALRSVGPQVIWTGYAGAPGTGFTGLLDGQRTLRDAIETWLASPTPANRPVIYAEQLMRGHRFDVFTASEASPTWRSLCGRYGQYTFGPAGPGALAFEYPDEGLVSPGASQKVAPPVAPVDPDFYVHESIARWHGWGLCAQRPGNHISRYANDTEANAGNPAPAPTSGGPSAPQMSAYFLPPSPAVAPELLFPKLRFGNRYQFRARGVDLAGNSVPVTSTDATTATPPFTHYRFEPVLPPAPAGMAPFTPGEATLYLVLLDDQVDTPVTNGRWLFPPRVPILMAEEHGMLDGFTLGQPPDPADGPSGAEATWQLLVDYDAANLGDVTITPGDFSAPLIGTYDTANQGVPYFTGSPEPWTPWLSDPLSSGPALTGLPGIPAGQSLTAPWGGVWPEIDPLLVTLAPGATPTSTFVAPTGSTPGTFAVTLPPAQVALVRLSSALAPAAFDQLGVWQWFGALPSSPLGQLASSGQVWLLSPFQVLRMVHAVRLPLLAPALGAPVASRLGGAVSVDIDDPEFAVDAPSTSHVDVVASWTDPYDNPAEPTVGTVTSGGPAFRLTIPDPTPTGPEAQPLTVVLPEEGFTFTGNEDTSTHAESATHHVGDTLHHLIYYTATGTSRFADLFETTETTSVTVGTALAIGNPALGLSGPSVEVTLTGGTVLVNGVDFTVDETAQTVTVVPTAARPSGSVYAATISFQPTVTVTGPPKPVEVLSTARPKAPVITQVVPAWQLEGPSGSVGSGGITVTRTGGFLRVYLDRPWYSSGDGELLGVVTTVTDPNDAYTSTFPSTTQQAWVTMMGIDPINAVQASNTPWPVVPTIFGGLAPLPEVPYRPPYANPPQVYLAEDPATLYQVWPYEVAFDGGSGRWYADIAPRPGQTDEGTYSPPPGYFIRLALCRFQPYSIPTDADFNSYEVSPVVMATFAQPVPDRAVSVVTDASDKTGQTVIVTVTGPGYQGFRPPIALGSDPTLQYDGDNLYAPQNPSIYGAGIVNTEGTLHTSTMVAEVQIQSEVLNKLGLSGDFGWETSGEPVVLTPSFSGQVYVTWGGPGAQAGGGGLVPLPYPVTSTNKMRLRISEIDYYTGQGAPAVVNNTFRRPFVSLIPLN
jgi:hypothetical protein